MREDKRMRLELKQGFGSEVEYLKDANKAQTCFVPQGRARCNWASHSLIALFPRFLEDLETLWGYPICPIFFWLWCCLSPIALIVLFSATMIILPLKNITYVAWDSSSVSLPLQTPDLSRERGTDLSAHS